MTRFVMLFDEDATPMMEAVMLHGMTMRFPKCRFDANKAPTEALENSVIPILGAVDLGVGDDVVMAKLPAGLRAEVSSAFDDLLREARAAQPS